MAWDGAQWNTLLPADYRPLRSPGAGTAEDCTVTSTGTGAPEEISFREDGIE